MGSIRPRAARNMQLISVIVRTLNEEKYLDELLRAIAGQDLDSDRDLEIVIVDSGSTDETLGIAERHQCRVTHICPEDFTFGRSLNRGAEFALGDILVFVSGHCVPANTDWLRHLIAPLQAEQAVYSYGRQIGRDTTKFSEVQVFQKYFPGQSRMLRGEFFCNNANAALIRSIWKDHPFDEEILGLEDMELAKRLVAGGRNIAYVASAPVYHIHDETWRQTERRYEREAIALQRIMPDVHVSFFDTLQYIFVSVVSDCRLAWKERCLWREIVGIVRFRMAQYLGSYRGNHEHRKLSKIRKHEYFYPRKGLGD